MNDKIDIVLPWLNSNDEHWKKQYEDYLSTVNTGDKSVSRIRDWDNLKYFLRSVDKNCKWVNKVVLCVFDEHQIPEWLNVKHSKLKILYHRDYIPLECMPTFNGLCSESFLFKSNEIENNIVYCNDDYFFVNETNDTDYFIDNVCVKSLIKMNDLGWYYYFKSLKDNVWCQLLTNTMDFKFRISGNKNLYVQKHLPVSFHKSDFTEFYKKYENDLIKEYSKYETKIRQNTNLVPPYIIDWLQGDKGDFIQDKDYFEKNRVYEIKDNYDFTSFFKEVGKLKTLCFNDDLENDIKTFEQVKFILESLFPEKSSFEI
jgi:hypothetical protein